MNADQGRRGLPNGSLFASAPSWIEWLVWGALAAAVVAIAVPVTIVITPLTGVGVAIAVPLALLQGATLVLQLIAPRTAAILHVIAVAGLAAVTVPTGAWSGAAATLPWPISVIGMIAFAALVIGLALRGRLTTAVATWITTTLLLVLAAVLAGPAGVAAGTAVADVIVSSSISAIGLAMAAITAQLAQAKRDVLTARRETEVLDERRRWDLERSRIAREMHDVVAHSMSIVHMRATSARYRLEGIGPEVADEFDGIAQQARSALGEMRGLLGVLREDADRLDAPQPGLADLPALLDATREAGIGIRHRLPDPVPTPSPAVQLAFYRVAQESLSNVARHASNAATDVMLDVRDDDLVLTVLNDPPPATPPEPSDRGGHGIRGMMERMTSIDGRLEHGPTPAGGYLVTARAPYRPVPSA